ncbi:MAG: hypothetical protein J5852_03960 [Clostridia bacterium]|nr:hypothetical protein [Clostridia bacterium]
MKDPTLKEIGILALIAVGIGLLVCLFIGEFSIMTVVFTALAVMGMGLSGVNAPTVPCSPEQNSFIYKTDLANGKIISVLQELNKDKPEAGLFESADFNSALYRTDLATGEIISELQKLNKK